MTVILGPTKTVIIEPTPTEVELSALRHLKLDIEAILSEPGHITKAEVTAILARYEERARA